MKLFDVGLFVILVDSVASFYILAAPGRLFRLRDNSIDSGHRAFSDRSPRGFRGYPHSTDDPLWLADLNNQKIKINEIRFGLSVDERSSSPEYFQLSTKRPQLSRSSKRPPRFAKSLLWERVNSISASMLLKSSAALFLVLICLDLSMQLSFFDEPSEDEDEVRRKRQSNYFPSMRYDILSRFPLPYQYPLRVNKRSPRGLPPPSWILFDESNRFDPRDDFDMDDDIEKRSREPYAYPVPHFHDKKKRSPGAWMPTEEKKSV
ncbi:unnamed protein product [Anisakis simplex]|uniref:Uncharacterized protein n=1 Tax=Anisakis simplex TaxID=6269 RepID=A0A0M3K1C3_ANISI|nr:unnamed protein product [Anisakis simplex]